MGQELQSVQLEHAMKLEVQDVAFKAREIKVVDKESYEEAAQTLQVLKGFKKRITDFFKPFKAQANQLHKTITKSEKDELKPVEEADSMLRASVSTYLAKEERERQEAQREAERIAAEQDVHVQPVAVTPTVEKTTKIGDGSITAKSDIKVEVTDMLLLIKAIASKDAPIAIVDIKMNKLKRWIKLEGKKELPGVSIKEVFNASVRG